MITSRVAQFHGVPTLYINDQPVAGAAYLTYLPERNDYASMAKAGCHLYSITLYFGRQSINEVTRISPFAPGIFDRKGQADFSLPDAEIQRILDADPEAYIFPRINTALPAWWEDENPDELNDIAITRRRPCFASQKWRDAIAEGLRLTAEHFAASPFADRIFGYQIGGGNTEEWFSFDQVGAVGLRAREAWERQRKPDSTQADWFAFLSRTTAEAIAYLAGKMKTYTHRRLVIGSFYGYTFETSWREAGHAALSRLLRCPDVDFLCSPASYAQSRLPGRDHACMTVLESVLLHGKLYFTEIDESTHLTRPLSECRENACVPGTYVGGRWVGPEDAAVARGVLRASFARQLTHGNSFWWFDMWGGWFRDPGMLSDFAHEEQILRQSLADGQRGLCAQAAVFIDETSLTHLPEGSPQGRVVNDFRIPLGYAGAPYASYDVSDFDAVRQQYRAFILVEPVPTPEMERVKQELQVQNSPVLLLTPETALTPDLFRSFFRASGVWTYCDTDDVVYANAHWLCIHAATAGTKTLRLPGRMRITPQFGEGEAFTARQFDVDMQAFETRLYRIAPTDDL